MINEQVQGKPLGAKSTPPAKMWTSKEIVKLVHPQMVDINEWINTIKETADNNAIAICVIGERAKAAKVIAAQARQLADQNAVNLQSLKELRKLDNAERDADKVSYHEAVNKTLKDVAGHMAIVELALPKMLKRIEELERRITQLQYAATQYETITELARGGGALVRKESDNDGIGTIKT